MCVTLACVVCMLHISCKRTGFKLCRLLFHLSHGHALMTDRFLFHVCASHKKKGKQREGEGGERRCLVFWKITVSSPVCWEPSVLGAW